MFVICDEVLEEDYDDYTDSALNNTSSLNGTVEYEAVDLVNFTNLIVVNTNLINYYYSKRILVFDRWNKSSVFRYYPLKVDKRQACTGCAVPTFVQYMDPNLFSKIQGVMSVRTRRESYLILFKIRERLQYCVTEYSEVWHNFDFEFN